MYIRDKGESIFWWRTYVAKKHGAKLHLTPGSLRVSREYSLYIGSKGVQLTFDTAASVAYALIYEAGTALRHP